MPCGWGNQYVVISICRVDHKRESARLARWRVAHAPRVNRMAGRLPITAGCGVSAHVACRRQSQAALKAVPPYPVHGLGGYLAGTERRVACPA